MRMRTKVSNVAVVGAGALLLMALAVIFTPRAQTAYAQNPTPTPTPRVSISIGEDSLRQGEGTYLVADLHNLPQDPIDDASFDNLSYRFDLERNSGDHLGANQRMQTTAKNRLRSVRTSILIHGTERSLQVGSGENNGPLHKLR